MENAKKVNYNGNLGGDHPTENKNTFRIPQRSGTPIDSTLSKPEVFWLQKEENRTKIQGLGNLWISNKPLWVSNGSQKTRSRDQPESQVRSQQVHKEKKYVVVGMRGSQIQDFHGAYRENTQVTSYNLRRSSGGDRPKPSKPKEE